jgi:hypothetical protein
MIKLETLVIAIGNLNGAFDAPESKAFQLKNPLMLRTYRPEKKVDSEHYRVFSTVGGGMKAGVSDLQAKCSGKNNRLSSDNTLKDLLAVYGFNDDRTQRRLIVFMQKALNDDSIYGGTKISWLLETPAVEEKVDA